MWNMSTDLTFATGRFPRAIRFVLINNRVPRMEADNCRPLAVEFITGWHIAYICEHLEAISKGIFLELGLENRLQINVPPGMMKSLLVSVFWPSWEWIYWPEMQYIVTSYRDEFCKRDTIRMRDLVLSPWYQMLFGEDHEMYFANADKSVTAKMIRGVQLVARTASTIQSSPQLY